VDVIPELAPRFRVDAGGRLVEQQQAWCVQQAGGQREALLPPPDKVPASCLWRSTKPRRCSAWSTACARAGSSNRRAMNSRFCRIDRSSYRPKRCVMYPTWRLIAAACVRMSSPRQVPLPASGVSSPHSMRIVVVLPLPFGPRKPQMRPRATRSATSSTTVRRSKRLVRPRTSIAQPLSVEGVSIERRVI
jgi:hypothetical protein